MCGIVGAASRTKALSLQHEDFQAMNDLIEHRGPDDDGFYFGEQVYLGMRRLSIIDLSTGKQPIFNEDESVVVVCNGEIYNFIELREELIARGHTFRTGSDTEVLVHLYEEEGMKMLEKLNGMFGFALYDLKQNRLFVARDRLGKKPLYYALHEDALVFGSEIKSLLRFPGFPREVDYSAMMNLLTFNYIPVPKTLFKGISKLPPGTYLSLVDGEVSLHTYWEMATGHEQYDISEEEAKGRLQELVSDAVRLRLRSDVPVGAFLSGGVDSSSVVAMMAEQVEEQFKTFSIGFEEEAFNELPFAQLVSELYHTEHITEVVKSQSIDMMPDVIWYTDNPHGDVSFIPTLNLSQLASRHVKVTLTGDGADELFAGYEKYDMAMKLEGTDEERWQQYHAKTSVFEPEHKQQLVSDELLALDDSDQIIQAAYDKTAGNLLDRILYFDMYYLLEGNNLVKPDRMAMAVGVETRVPFLDYRVVDFVTRLPSALKWHEGTKKYLLKNMMRDRLPSEILDRKKQMFTVPIGEWIKNDLKDLFRAVLLSERFLARGYYKRELVEQMLNDHIEGRNNYTRQLRLLLVLELWHRIFIDRESLAKPTFAEIVDEVKGTYV